MEIWLRIGRDGSRISLCIWWLLDEKVKASLLIHCIGDKAKEIYNPLTLDAVGDNMNYEKIMEKFEAYLAPRKNITFSRYKFLTYRQERVKILINIILR